MLLVTSKEKLCGIIGLATRAGKVIFGTQAVIGAIEKRKTKLIIIANDRTKLNFQNICKQKNIPIFEILATEVLSKTIGKPNKVVIGIIDENFSKEISKIINGGEVIG